MRGTVEKSGLGGSKERRRVFMLEEWEIGNVCTEVVAYAVGWGGVMGRTDIIRRRKGNYHRGEVHEDTYRGKNK